MSYDFPAILCTDQKDLDRVDAYMQAHHHAERIGPWCPRRETASFEATFTENRRTYLVVVDGGDVRIYRAHASLRLENLP